MAYDDDIPDVGSSSGSDYVAVVVARSIDHAETFRELLEDHDIPSILGTEDDDAHANDADPSGGGAAMTRGVPVLVPEALLDEATGIIADREDFEDLEEENLDEEDEKFSLDDGMTEEVGPVLADEELVDDDDDQDGDDLDDEDEYN